MSALVKFPGDVRIAGNLIVEGGQTIPAASVGDAQANPSSPLDVDKTKHQHLRGHSQPNTAATTETRTLHVARSTGVVEEIVAGSIAKAVGDSTVTIDLKKNGASILTAVITLDNANTNRVVEPGTLSSSSYVAGDWFEIVITATVGTGTLPTGVFVQAGFSEGAIP